MGWMNEENSIHKNKIILLFLNYIIINHKKNILFKLDEMRWLCVFASVCGELLSSSSNSLHMCNQVWELIFGLVFGVMWMRVS